MARQTFFSFRYKKDNWRAGIVRNSWVTQERKASSFFDSAEWEEVKKKNDSAIEEWIGEQKDFQDRGSAKCFARPTGSG